MKIFNIIPLILLTLIMISSCSKSTENETGYTPPEIEFTSNKLTPELLLKMGRLSGETVSPDGKNVLYGVTYFDIAENKSYRDLYVYNIKNKSTVRISDTAVNENNAVWSPDGKKIAFTCNESGSEQLWEMNTDGTQRKQISFFDKDLLGFKFSPCGKKIVFVMKVKLDSTVNDIHPDLPKANARIENDIMYRHWDSWHDYSYNHLFIADYSENGISGVKDIMENEKYHSPTVPFGGIDDFAWSRNGEILAYVCKKKNGKEYAFSTNTEIWLYDTANGETTNFTDGNFGYDMSPVFSPCGKYLAYTSMARNGYEADQARLFIANIKTGERKNLFQEFEESAHNILWDSTGTNIYFISDIKASDQIFKVDIKSSHIEQLSTGIHNFKSIQWAENKLMARKHSMSAPDDLYLFDLQKQRDEAITAINANITSNIEFGKVEKRWVKTSDNKDMLVWVIYPPEFDASKKYPALLYCQGGPQGTVSQFWSYRWNFQLMAANNYIIVAPNRRGLPGFGMEWLEQISTDYGGQNISDYLSAIDAVSAESYVDKNRLGAVGASYGGFSVFYLAGHHQKRFKAFVSHAGIFNFEQMYTTTEEMFFVNWDLGGPYWDKSNKVAQRSYSFSPHHFVDKWDTPILVIHGENDYRIPYTQGMAAYNTAIMRGIPAQYLHFHDENHWVLKPQNAILWHRTFYTWLDKWLKVDE